jgi:hypothetical protein
VVWQDNRNSATTQTDIYCARVTTAGTVDDPSGVVVSQSARVESGPVIVPVSSTQCGAYYANSTYSINRLRGRIVWLTTPPPPEYDIDDAKQLPEGTPVTLADVVVTAGNNQLTGKFYVEDREKLSGIKVVWSGSTVSESNPVIVSGSVVTVDGERQVTATSVEIGQWTPVVPVPLSMHAIDLGGVAAGIVPGIGSRGPNNIGLLVKIWGIVRNPAAGYFELEDANGVRARVKCPVTLPTSGLMYKVVGISSCEPITGGYQSVLLVRKAGDIQSVP